MKSRAESNHFLPKYSLNINGRLLDLSVPKVMGILNVTPDSFYDGSLYRSETEILHQVEKMLSAGADMIDIGGYSTRPGAADITPAVEIDRVLSAIRPVVREFPGTIISIDTFRSAVARAAFLEGASMINDVSGGTLDPEMFSTAAALKAPYVLMHMRGNPQTMTTLSDYGDVVLECISELQLGLNMLHEAGVYNIILDPGFGFAKTIPQNFELLDNLDRFNILGQPLLVGISRKSMIWKTLETTPEEALNGTTALHSVALLKGASILRVHDVREAVQTIQLFRNLKITHRNN
jgi:dihydropteroate synthase